MRRPLAIFAAALAAALALGTAACGGGAGAAATSSTSTPTSLTWEGAGYSGDYSTTFDGLSAGDPVAVAYDLAAGSATIELSHDGAAPYSWDGATGSGSEVVYVSEGGSWTATITLRDASGSASVEVQAYAGDEDEAADAPADGARLANPFQDAASLDELSELAGFDVRFPDELPGFGAPVALQAIPGELAQARYGADGAGVLVRKGAGDDVSGDYNDYDYTSVVQVGDAEVTLSGDGADSIRLAVWTAGGFGYSVAVDDGVTPDAMEELVALVTD